MQKNAFTMIEVIFVILIIAVLATVALPKFFGVREQAEKQTVLSFASTMTRTVGHTLWSISLTQDKNGSIIDSGSASTSGGKQLSYYVDIPVELDRGSIDFSRCVAGSGVAQPFITPKGSYEYNIFCCDGNITTAPKFVASKESSYTF